MNYVADALYRTGFSVNIISPSWLGENSSLNFSPPKKITVQDDINITFLPSWKHRTKLGRKLKVIFSLTWLFFYLLATTKKDEKIIVYHAQWLSWPIRWSKRVRKYHVILEIEEIYSEVWKNSTFLNNAEQKLLSIADSYIFVSEKLKEKFESENKKSLILYGAYEQKYSNSQSKLDDGITHLVYAGSIDRVKGGAFKSLEILKSLPGYFKLHILGGGTRECIEELNQEISDINKEKKCEAIIYKGTLHGSEFTDYLMKCDIALNPQNQGEYMNTAFPSKVITYLAHNLKVVSTPIESIKLSQVAKYINFSKDDSVEGFVELITGSELLYSQNNFNIINRLDQDFIMSLKNIFDN